jgi:hypothetical protein
VGFADRPLQLGDVVTAPRLACSASAVAAGAVMAGARATGVGTASDATPADAAAADTAAATAGLPLNAFCGVYRLREQGGPVLFDRLDASIDFDWDAAAPGGYWLDDPTAGFTARWAGRFEFLLTSEYTFRLAATVSRSFLIDGVPVVDFVPDPSGQDVLLARVNLTTGIHRIDISADSVDGKGILQLGWSAVVTDRRAGHWARFLQLR